MSPIIIIAMTAGHITCFACAINRNVDCFNAINSP